MLIMQLIAMYTLIFDSKSHMEICILLFGYICVGGMIEFLGVVLINLDVNAL